MVSIGVFRSALPIIYIVKRKLDKDKELTEDEHRTSVQIGIAIVRDGIDHERLKTQELMAAIFVVNFIAKSDDLDNPRLAYDRKDALQKSLIVREGIEKRRGYRRFRGTIEIRVYSIRITWITHVPRRLLKQWGMKA